MFIACSPLSAEGLEWSDRGVNIHSQLSEAPDRPCGGSEIVRGRGVNGHSMLPDWNAAEWRAAPRPAAASVAATLFVRYKGWRRAARAVLVLVAPHLRLCLPGMADCSRGFSILPVFPQPGRLPKVEEIRGFVSIECVIKGVTRLRPFSSTVQ